MTNSNLTYKIGVDAAMAAINSGRNVFITGPGGSGKSKLIATLREWYGDSTLLLGPTGISALNIKGMSCHKACGLSFGITTADDCVKAKSKKQAILMSSKAIDMIIIDEISMVRSDKLHEMDQKFRHYRKVNEPFGGLQVVVFGDGFQISPVLLNNEKAMFRQMFGDEIPFGSPTWKELNFVNVYLDKVYRQTDPVFAMHLNNLRVGKDVPQAIAYFNDQCHKELLPDAVTLTTTNKLAEEINKREYDKLPGKGETFKAKITGEFTERPVLDNLDLKVGVKVMITVNDSEEPSKYVNGTVGVVERIAKSYVLVNIDGKSVPIYQKTWDNVVQKPEKYVANVKKIEVQEDGTEVEITVAEEKERLVDDKVGSFTQFPFKLGYAITGHKAQGLTLGKVNLNMGMGAFTPGQAYVMLSRAKSIEGLRLEKPLRRKDIMVDYRVANFYRKTFPGLF